MIRPELTMCSLANLYAGISPVGPREGECERPINSISKDKQIGSAYPALGAGVDTSSTHSYNMITTTPSTIPKPLRTDGLA